MNVTCAICYKLFFSLGTFLVECRERYNNKVAAKLHEKKKEKNNAQSSLRLHLLESIYWLDSYRKMTPILDDCWLDRLRISRLKGAREVSRRVAGVESVLRTVRHSAYNIYTRANKQTHISPISGSFRRSVERSKRESSCLLDYAGKHPDGRRAKE